MRRRRTRAVIRGGEDGRELGSVRCTVHRSSYEEILEDDAAFSGETAVAVICRGGEALRRGMILEVENGIRYTVQNVSPGVGRTFIAKLRRFVFQGEV